MTAGTVTRRLVERRRRGLFGWFFLLLFWGFNALMAYAIFSGIGGTMGGTRPVDTAMRQAHDAGAGLAFLIWLVFWAAGAVVFGLLAHFSRGKREMIEVETRTA